MNMPPFEDMRDINLQKLRHLDEEVGVDLEDVAEMLTERDYRIAELDAEVRRSSGEVRYAKLSAGRAREEVLDEVVGRGLFHLESLGWHSWMAWVGRFHCTMYLERLPRQWWWEEIKDAWSERRLPWLWRITIRLNEEIEQ